MTIPLDVFHCGFNAVNIIGEYSVKNIKFNTCHAAKISGKITH